MHRRRIARLSLLALALTAAPGCATFSDNDAVARVGDVELSSDQLADRLPAPPTDAVDRVDGDATRQAVTEWIRGEILGASEVARMYETGLDTGDALCLDIALAQDAAVADAIKARVDGGEEWDTVVAPLEAELGFTSRQPCQPWAALVEQAAANPADAAVVEQLGALRPDGTTIVVDAGGFVVLRLRPLEEVDLQELLTIVGTNNPDVVDEFISSVDAADVYVDPRIGTFDAETGSVVAVN